jgi:flagellar assembly protein FliH
MAVLKNTTSNTLVKDAIVLDLGDLRQQAEKLRRAAEARAEAIVAEARSKASEVARSILADAHRKGREEGLEQGLAEGRAKGHAEALAKAGAQLQQLQNAWTDAMAAWDARKADMERDVRLAVLQMAVIFAEKVAKRVIEADRSVVVDQVAAALRLTLKPSDVTVHIHPDDRLLLEEAMPRLMASFSHLKHITLIEESNMTRGGCVVVSGQGRIDATVETQLQRLAELLVPAQPLADADDAEAPGLPPAAP